MKVYSGKSPFSRGMIGGFTVMEILIFSGIFTLLMVAFISILVTITAVHTRQTSVSEVNQQSQFLLQRIQHFVERSSVIELASDTATTTLKLRMPADAEDPTYIYLASSTVYLKQKDTGSAQPLTSNKVSVSSLSFSKKSNPPGHDSVSVSMVVAFNTQNIKQQFSEALQTTVARVSAATFDSDIRASVINQYMIGSSAQEWRSINDTLYFSGSNVGIGVSSPSSKFQVSGGDVYVNSTGSGLILKSANGTCWRITPSNTGAYSSVSITCP